MNEETMTLFAIVVFYVILVLFLPLALTKRRETLVKTVLSPAYPVTAIYVILVLFLPLWPLYGNMGFGWQPFTNPYLSFLSRELCQTGIILLPPSGLLFCFLFWLHKELPKAKRGDQLAFTLSFYLIATIGSIGLLWKTISC